MTNADRIRAMSDEELAEWISNGYYIPHCPTLDGCPDDIGTYDGCDGCWLKWLKSKVDNPSEKTCNDAENSEE